MLSNNVRILCTRPLSDTLINKASEKGIDITCVPFIKTQNIATPAVTDRIHHLSSKQINAIFTSLNAVESVIQELQHKPAWRIFCMGGVTKDLVFKFFGEKYVAATAKNATLLAEKVIAAKVKDAVFFCGDQRMDDLPEILHANNINVEEVIVYTTVQTPEVIEQNFKGIVFFSPSAVHSFFSTNTIALTVVLFAIGKTTAATIQSYCTNKIIISDWPGRESMIDKVLEYYTENQAD